MSSEAEALFLDALDLAPTERRRWLDERTRDAPQLRAEVESLLAADAQAEGFLDPPAVEDEPDDAFGRWLEGRRIGRYTIRHRIGLGGMSTVYEAMQDRPRRRVALKLLRAGLSTRELRRRFEQEAEILGRLRHPGIAEIYEAGTHESEVGPIPFFALELLDGARSLTRYARDRELSPEERLSLMVQVCRAVQHAHDHGVIHRDLKPSNILVGEDGRPKLIDFGVARALDDEMRAVTLRTSVGDMLGTLYYMSPEQCAADGRPIDARTDVYSLGVVLYELLTGKLPYPVETTAGPAVPELIREHVPRAPSTGSQRRRRDVDAVVLTALEKDPDRRYATAGALADDIERCVQGEPPRAARSRHGHHVSRAAARVKKTAPLFAAGALATWAALAAWRSPPEADADASSSQAAAAGAAEPVEPDERAAYLHCIIAAQQAFESRDLPRAKALLPECAPAQRGWEWRRLAAIVDRSTAVLPVGSPVHTLRYSPRADRLVAATEDGRVIAWSVEAIAGDRPRVVERWSARAPAPIDALAIDDAHGVVYAGGEARAIAAFDAADGEPREGLSGLRREVWALAIDPAARRLYAGSHEGELAAWDSSSRARVLATNVGAPIQSIAVSPDGESLVLAHTDGTVGVYDASDGHRVRILGRHSDGVEAAVWTSAGIVSGGWEDRLRVFDPLGGGEATPIGEHADGILDLALVGEDAIASASRDGTIAVWPLAGGRRGPVLRGHDYGVEAIAVGEGAEWIASASLDGTVRLWDLHAPPTDHRIDDPRDKVQAVAWAEGGRVLLAAGGPQWGRGDGDEVFAWSMPDAEPIARADDHARTIDALAISRDETRAVTGSRDGEVAIRDRATLVPTARGVVHEGAVRALAFAPGDAVVVSAGEDGSIAWIDPVDARVVRRVHAGVGPLHALATPSDTRVVAVGERGLVRIDAGAEPVRWSAEATDPFVALAPVSADRVVVGTDSGAVTLLDVATLRPIWTSATFGRGVNDLHVSPDGTRIAVASEDYRIRLLDATTGELALVVGAHASVATSVAFSPSGDAIASGGFDRSVRVWSAPAG